MCEGPAQQNTTKYGGKLTVETGTLRRPTEKSNAQHTLDIYLLNAEEGVLAKRCIMKQVIFSLRDLMIYF